MKNIFLFFSLIFISFSCQNLSLLNRNPAASNLNSENIKRQYIIAVHGIGGDETTFGSMKTVLVDHLKTLRPETEFIFLSFKYPTGNSELSTFDFAYKSLSQFLRQQIPKPESTDRITFVAHSQGGLVASIWYAGAALGVDQDGEFDTPEAAEIKKDQVYANITHQIITLGTPFWGSKLATFLNDEERFQVQKLPGLNLLFSLGDSELKEMSFLSNTIYSFRHTAIALTNNPRYQNLKQPEFIQIAGVYPRDEKKLFYDSKQVQDDSYFRLSEKLIKIITKSFMRLGFSSEKINSSEPDRPESDVAVIVPSSRSEFYYATQKVTCQTDHVDSSIFKKASVFKNPSYFLTESIHSPLVSQRSVGIANIPEFCKNPNECKHPSYRILLNSIAHCDRYACRKEAQADIINAQFELNRTEDNYNMFLTNGSDLQGFSVEVDLRVPSDYDFPVAYFYNGSPNDLHPLDQKWILKQKEIFRKIISPRWDLISKDQSDLFEIKSARPNEVYSSLVQIKDMTFKKINSKHVRIHMTGLLKLKTLEMNVDQAVLYNKILNEGAVFPFEVNLPRYIDNQPKKQIIKALIKPGYTTFIDLDFKDAINCAQ